MRWPRFHDNGPNDAPAALDYYAKASVIGRAGDEPGSSLYAINAADHVLLLLRLGGREPAEPLPGRAIRILPAEQSHRARARIGLASVVSDSQECAAVENSLRIPAGELTRAELDAPGIGARYRALRDKLRSMSAVADH